MMEIIDCDQNSPEWFAARLGIPTASKFATVMAKGKSGGASLTRSKYMRELAAEIITGQPTESYRNEYMERGHAQEADARETYSFMHECELELVGFIRNGQKGASPDSLVGNNGLLEIKTKKADLIIECIQRGPDNPPPEHIAQCQGQLLVAEREWLDLVCYSPSMPLVVYRINRDDKYIKTLSEEVDRFNEELQQLVETISNYGKQAD